jgi:hypothetical protein
MAEAEKLTGKVWGQSGHLIKQAMNA